MGGTFTISFSTVSGNTAPSGGTALYNANITATVKRHFVNVAGTIVNWPGSF